MGKAAFLGGLAIAGAVLLAAVWQVPQPWRAGLVAWLLIAASAGTLVVKVMQARYAYKTAQLTAKPRVETARPQRVRAPRRAGALQIARHGGAGGRRSPEIL